jgi:hypothetical protein
MPDPKKKLVKIEGVGIVAFPSAMPDHKVAEAISTFQKSDYSDVPAFLKNSLDMGKVRQVQSTPTTATERHAIATVSDDDPYKVKVFATDLYGSPDRNHELTHTFQFTRNKSLPDISAPIKGTGIGIYDYGGLKGLQDSLTQKKTIADFNAEQQAQIVKDYKYLQDKYLEKAAQGKITPEELKHMYAIHQAYHPFVQQLAGMPGQNENLDRHPLLELIGAQKPLTIGTKPQAPGLPSYDTPGLGVVPADPLMGGQSQSILERVKKEAQKRRNGVQ